MNNSQIFRMRNIGKFLYFSITDALLFCATMWAFFVCCYYTILFDNRTEKVSGVYKIISSDDTISLILLGLIILNIIIAIIGASLKSEWMLKFWLFCEILQWLFISYIMFMSAIINFSSGFALFFASTAYFSLKSIKYRQLNLLH